MRKIVAMSLLVVTAACVTINVYFPAVAAEKAADRIIDNVWGKDKARDSEPAPEQAEPDNTSAIDAINEGRHWAAMALGSIIGTAHAQADIDISSPAIQAITRSMEARHKSLVPHYNSGAVGLTQNGEVALRDQSLVPLKDRNTLRQLVADENGDRRSLYREIAAANGHPEWEADIRDIFAKRWITKARSGWHYQDGIGAWKQK